MYKSLCLVVCLQLVSGFNHDRKDWQDTDVKHLGAGVVRSARASPSDYTDDVIDEVFGLPELKQQKRQTWSIPMPDMPPEVAKFIYNTIVPNGNQYNYYFQSPYNPMYPGNYVAMYLPIFIPLLYCLYPPSANGTQVTIDNRFLFPDDPQLNGLGGQGPNVFPTTRRPPYAQPAPPAVPDTPRDESGDPDRSQTGIALIPARPNRPPSRPAPPVNRKPTTTTSAPQSIPQGVPQFSDESRYPAAQAVPRPSLRPANTGNLPTQSNCQRAFSRCCSQYGPGSGRDNCFMNEGCGGPVWGEDPCDFINRRS